MRSMIQYCKFLLAFILSLNFLYSVVVKPSNKKLDIVKIKDENKKTRTYYHLDKNGELYFTDLDKYVQEKDASYNVKIITRAKISPNSNSSKVFGIDLSVLENGVEKNRILKYKKGASLAKKSSKSGFNFTQAGFWQQEIKKIDECEILIKLAEGSPELDVRLVIDKINYRKNEGILNPVNREKSYKVKYKNSTSDSTYKKSKGWYLIDSDKDVQFKLKGPKQVRIISRGRASDSHFYSFSIRENGKYMSDYFYPNEKSSLDAHIILNDDKVSLTGYNSFFFNVPDGIHYYTIRSSEDESSAVLLKLQNYIEKK